MSIEYRRNVSGALTSTNNLGYLVLQLVIVIAIETKIVYKDSSTILINFIKGIQYSNDQARQEQYFIDPPTSLSRLSLIFKKGQKIDNKGLLQYQDRIQILYYTVLRQEIIIRNYNNIAIGYYGNIRTCKILRRKYQQQNINSNITTYIKSYNVY